MGKVLKLKVLRQKRYNFIKQYERRREGLRTHHWMPPAQAAQMHKWFDAFKRTVAPREEILRV